MILCSEAAHALSRSGGRYTSCCATSLLVSPLPTLNKVFVLTCWLFLALQIGAAGAANKSENQEWPLDGISALPDARVMS